MIGDTKQLQTIGAGKPFEQAQERGTPTSPVTENLRAASPQMKAVAAALEREDLRGAFAALKDRTLELPRLEGVETAAAIWVSRGSPEARERTLLLTLSRAMRSTPTPRCRNSAPTRASSASRHMCRLSSIG